MSLWLLPGPILAGLAVLVRWIARHRRRWAQAHRRRRAWVRATRGLRRASTCGEAWQAAARFFQERFDTPGAGLSPLDATETLLAHAVPPETVEAIRAILQPLFDQSFRPDAADDGLLARTHRELPPLLARCSARPRPSPTARGTTLVLLATLGAAGSLRASDEQRFLWNQANARMATAATPAEFAEAARIYRDLIERGARSAPAFRNYGTALLLAEAPEAAADALLRSERLGGSSPDLRRNLELALAVHRPSDLDGTTSAAPAAEGLPWTRVPLFWHYQLPLRTRVQVLLALHNLLWIAALLRVVRLRALARGLFAASVAGLVMFGSSVAVSAHQDATPLPEPVYRWAATEGSP